MRSIRDCCVAVVGGAGFLGSHLVNHLTAARNCRVLVIDNLVSGRREFLQGMKNVTFEYADVTQSETHLKKLFERYKTQFVFNYAACPYVPTSYDRPLYVFAINAVGAMHVINAAHEAGVEAILQVSSAEVYGDERCPRAHDAWGQINEHAPVTPHSSYGASKAAIDSWVQVRWKEAKTPCIALRQFNCVGERETHPYVIPEIIGQAYRCWQTYGGGTDADDSYHTIRLGNNSFRDFLYAGDQAIMATELLEKGQFGEVYNLGSESGIQIYELATLICQLVGLTNSRVVEDLERVRPWEIWHLQSDNAKIYQVIDRRPQVSLQDALLKTIHDYKRNNGRWCWEK